MKYVVVLEGFPNHEIHQDGRVFRVRGNRPGEVKSHIGHRKGYKKIQLMHAGVRHSFWVHRLVCIAFHGDPPDYNGEEAYVRHLDNNPLNNHADNLRWGSKIENERDKRRFCAPLVGRWSDNPKDAVTFD